MGKESSHTQTLSGLWRNDWHNAYWVIIPGDLVSVGPVHYKRLGIALEGVVVGRRAIKTTLWHTGGSSSNTWRILIQWNDGTRTEEAIGDIMRLE